MSDIALASPLGPLGDFDIHLGGREAGLASNASWLVVVTVRLGAPLRHVEVRLERTGAVHLEDHLRFTAALPLVSPERATELVKKHLALDASVPDAARVRRLLEASGEPAADPVPPRVETAPTNENELRIFLEGPPFPQSGGNLTEPEVKALGLALPRAARADPYGPSLHRARVLALDFARANVGKLAGTPIEARIHRMTESAFLVLDLAGQKEQAALVGSWRGLPLAEHPVALDLVTSTAFGGPTALPTPVALRPVHRAAFAAADPGARNRQHLLSIELASSIAATLELAWWTRTFRDELPRVDALRSAARAAAIAAIGEGGQLSVAAARASLEASLPALAPEPLAAEIAEMGSRSVLKLTELAQRAPVRDWAVGPLNEVMPAGHFTNGAPR